MSFCVSFCVAFCLCVCLSVSLRKDHQCRKALSGSSDVTMMWACELLAMLIDDYYLVSILYIVSCEESRTPTVYGRAYILGRADHYRKDDQKYHSVSVIEAIDVVVIVSHVDLGD